MSEIITPVVTIFNEDETIDYEGNKKVIDFLINNGVDGILVLGSTGEFTRLTYKEKKEFFEFYSKYVNGRTKIYAGTSEPAYENTIKLSNECTKLGFDGVMIIGPNYYALDQNDIFNYYNTISKEIETDIYIYNFPNRSGHCISAECFKKLTDENKNIVGLKDSVTEQGHTGELLRATKSKKLKVYSGFDDQFLYNITNGGAGCIGALSNIVPDIWSDLVNSFNKQKYDRVFKLTVLVNELMDLYSVQSNFSLLFKCLMVERGVDINPRAMFPYNHISKEQLSYSKNILNDVLEKYKKIV